MEIEFDYSAATRFLALRLRPGPHETIPFLREMRFWGVDQPPCPGLGTVAALLALKDHPLTHLTLREGAMNAPVCTALSRHFDIDIHPATYLPDARALLGGERGLAPVRFGAAADLGQGVREVLTWTGLDDLSGTLGGTIRTNLDAFDLDEPEKSLIVALCCGGKTLGRIAVAGIAPELVTLMHRLGLELIDPGT